MKNKLKRKPVIFIELPKVIKLESSIEKNSALENWAIFLKEADNPKKTRIIQKLTETEAGLMNAKRSLSSISANQDLWVQQFRQEMFERDYRSGLSAAENRGIAIGEERGKEAGRSEAKLEDARNMLMENLPAETVARCTGLSLETVQQLAEQLKTEPVLQ